MRAQHAHVVHALEAKLTAAAHLDAARDEILAFTAFPARWDRIRPVRLN